MKLQVSKTSISCKCVIVNKNVHHCFSSEGQLHVSIILLPTSSIAWQVANLMVDKEYDVIDILQFQELQDIVLRLIASDKPDDHSHFIQKFRECLGLCEDTIVYDNRILKLFSYIEDCECDDHALSFFADKVALSPSRLSHLFREQVGLPLKSYIQLHQMQKAFLAILQGEHVTDAALLANFDSPSHFASVTKRMIGMSATSSLKDSVFLKV